ncbi:MAG: 3-hydroxyanthranilate 3,4-dioxygenase [Planctomycetes bacterium]|nr:3-hydroxyanthranilate 3,4-dioxygenase [Planctomycetota bacterium]
MVTVGPPFNLRAWIAEHRALLQPPVGNALVWEDTSFMVMIVGGPNQRADYHINPTEEFYHQIEGDITLRIRENDRPRDIPIRQGEVFLLPSGIPHSPQRPAGTVGMVVEHKRPKTLNDHLRWYCPACDHVLHDAAFHLTNLAKQIKPVIQEFFSRPDLRTCAKCGHVLQPPAAS